MPSNTSTALLPQGRRILLSSLQHHGSVSVEEFATEVYLSSATTRNQVSRARDATAGPVRRPGWEAS